MFRCLTKGRKACEDRQETGHDHLANLLVHLDRQTDRVAHLIVLTVRVRDRKGGKRSQETVYIVTSLTHRQTSPGQLAAWVRGQWAIENGLHSVRDVTQGEDASRVRTGHAPQNLAALRDLGVNLFRFAGHDNIAAAHRQYADQPHLVGPTLAAAR